MVSFITLLIKESIHMFQLGILVGFDVMNLPAIQVDVTYVIALMCAWL